MRPQIMNNEPRDQLMLDFNVDSSVSPVPLNQTIPDDHEMSHSDAHVDHEPSDGMISNTQPLALPLTGHRLNEEVKTHIDERER